MDQNNLCVQFINDILDALPEGYSLTEWGVEANPDFTIPEGCSDNPYPCDDSVAWLCIKMPVSEGAEIPNDMIRNLERKLNDVMYKYNSGSSLDWVDFMVPAGHIALSAEFASDDQRDAEEWNPHDYRAISDKRMGEIMRTAYGYLS